jgi:hypothetical protein
MLESFIKTYADKTYQYATLIRHQGTVIGFAMDSQRQIYYTILNLNGDAKADPLDVNHWLTDPQRLPFSNEIAEVGFGVADQTVIPASPNQIFTSTTARFTADAPFQVISDGRFVYLFRQAIAANHPQQVFKTDREGQPVLDRSGNKIPLVDATLLCDRYIVVLGGVSADGSTGASTLTLKQEVRFRRSRSKTRPQSNKDSLGAKDMEEKPFLEPTQELSFVRELTNGRFSVLLLPTEIAEVQRWQIFAQSSRTGMIDAYNVERSPDGLFNTQGSQAGTTEGAAEFALNFPGNSSHVDLGEGIKLPPSYTQELWIRPQSQNSTELVQILLSGDGTEAQASPQIALINQRQLRLSFGDGQSLRSFTTDPLLTMDDWNHVAVSLAPSPIESIYRVFVNGVLQQEFKFSGMPRGGSVRFIGSPTNSIQGQIDEIRIWDRARSQSEIKADLHQHLTGHELGLISYWRLDEGSGKVIGDQSGNQTNGQLKGVDWIASDAPIGETTGINRDRFQFADRQLSSGLSALLYFQQEKAKTGYDQTEKPLKRGARVMLAAATTGKGDRPEIAVLDFSVAATGKLAACPDLVVLPEIQAQQNGGVIDLNQTLNALARLQEEVRQLTARQADSEPQHNYSKTAITVVENAIQRGRVLKVNPGIAASFPAPQLPIKPDFLKNNPLIQSLEDQVTNLNNAATNSVTAQNNLTNARLRLPPNSPLSRPLELAVSAAQNAVDTAIAALVPTQAGLDQILQSALGDINRINQRLGPAQIELDQLQQLINQGLHTPAMPLLSLDRAGLSVTGGLLKFAWSKDTPSLFESALGRVALYFRGMADEFFVAYYETLTERAKLHLVDGKQQKAQSTIVCFPRSADAAMDGLQAVIKGSEVDTCTVTFTLHTDQVNVTETWTNVPRSPQALQQVLNGQAGQPIFVGNGHLEGTNNQAEQLIVAEGISRSLSVGMPLRLGTTKVTVRETAKSGATMVAVTGVGAFGLDAAPVFTQLYDYDNASLPNGDLSRGSTLVLAVAATAGEALVNQTAIAEATVSCRWIADAPGHTLALDGTGHAGAEDAEVTKFQATGDLTLEAWVQPDQMGNRAHVLCHRSSKSHYSLALQRQKAKFPALQWSNQQLPSPEVIVQEGQEANSPGQCVVIPVAINSRNLSITGAITLEMWVLIQDTSRLQTLFSQGDRARGNLNLNLRVNSNVYELETGLLPDDRDFPPILVFPLVPSKTPRWVHLAVVSDGREWRFYENGTRLQAQGVDPKAVASSPRGAVASDADICLGARLRENPGINRRLEQFFSGRMMEVRWWRTARSRIDLQVNMHRSLKGNEADLLGYWPLTLIQGRTVLDRTQGGNHGLLFGAMQPAIAPLESALTNYAVIVGVNDRFVQTNDSIPANNWTHLAAVFRQARGIQFDGVASSLDAGNDLTLDINRDLTLELFLRPGVLDQRRCLITRGYLDRLEEPDQRVPYALWLDPQGRLVFGFEDVEGGKHYFISNPLPNPNTFHKIALTRKRQTDPQRSGTGADTKVTVITWDDITIYDNGTIIGQFQYRGKPGNNTPVEIGNSKASTEMGVGFSLPVPFQGSINGIFLDTRQIGTTGTDVILDLLTKLTQMPPDVKVSDSNGASRFLVYQRQLDALAENGLTIAPGNSTLGEARFWNLALEVANLRAPLSGNEKGLVSWWQFEETDGNLALDRMGNNSAKFKGAIQRVNDPNSEGSQVDLYRNGEKIATQPIATIDSGKDPQFTLGGVRQNNQLTEAYQGAMEEIRIWRTRRTLEQIQDNLFRRLLDERNLLIAYYSFDLPSEIGTTPRTLLDGSLQANSLKLSNQGNSFILSTAPIGPDTPQVRSALAGIETAFSDRIGSSPSVQEYGDLQTDSLGSLQGVFKRCYSLIQGGQWRLITGFKVGDLITEWVGQAQFDPQLIGFIEGAPPVPGENLTSTGVNVGEFSDYNGATSVELVEAQKTNFTFAANKETGFDTTFEFTLAGFVGAKLDVGIGVEQEALDIVQKIGGKASFESSLGFLDAASTSFGRSTTKISKLELRGRVENKDDVSVKSVGRRFVPENVGFALVQSQTADVFALRLKQTQALVSFQMRPNPDIPPDKNIITFPLNPNYTKQGTLDGKIGFEADPDYPNSLTLSTDSSYYKPLEAYALKSRLQRETEQIRTGFDQFDAGTKGRSASEFNSSQSLGSQLPRLERRNLVNNFVWTADGGLFAETEETLDVVQETAGGSYSFKGLAGAFGDLNFGVQGIGLQFTFEAMMGGHINFQASKSSESENSFGVNINVDRVERDVFERDVEGNVLLDLSDPKRPRPKRQAGKVDAYRFMTFYLEPQTEHFNTFFDRVVDPIWLSQSDDPNAIALRQANQDSKKPACWRIMHRVTFVSRVLPKIQQNSPRPTLDQTLRDLNIDSNFELIKRLEPFIIQKVDNFSVFTAAVKEAIQSFLPELQPHTTEVVEFLLLFYGITQ